MTTALPPTSPSYDRTPLSPSSEESPSFDSQLTPGSSTADSGDGEAAIADTVGRGTKLQKLRTDLPNDTDGEDTANTAFPGGDELGFERGFGDGEEHIERYRDNPRRIEEEEDDPELASYSLNSFTPEEEARVVRKFDRRLTLLMAFLYMLSFLDRSNIGNAKIAGLMEDLHLSSSQYEWTLTAFYITYIIFEWMTLLYKVMPAHIYIPICVFSWGTLASLQCLVTSFNQLLILRALLGISEAAFGPGLPFFLSFFYKREELAFRTGMFLCAAPLATSFAGTLAWLIVWVSEDGPIAPWRALFLYEGFPSIIVAAVAWAYIPDGPGKAKYLTPRERRVAKLRLKMADGGASKHASRSHKFDWREVGRTLTDPKSYITALMYLSCNVAFSSLPVFLPTILNDMGYSSHTAQALSAPPYLFAFVVVLITASLSDRSRSRSPFLILHALLSSGAYMIIALTGYFHAYFPPSIHILIRYICIYPAAAGFFSAITIIIAWTMDNRPAKEGKGTGMALLNIIGQCGPLIGTRLYPQTDSPWYIRGMAICSLFMLFVALLAGCLRVLLQRENARELAAAGRAQAGTGRQYVEEDIFVGNRTDSRMEAEGLIGAGNSVSVLSGANGDGMEKAAGSRFVYIV
ncbi:hypothetical protein FQN57_000730 [Myotisia sp. PD_48]|nr:hypothetical protein FQN57_000730 [Myotisia sp. PD_48]